MRSRRPPAGTTCPLAALIMTFSGRSRQRAWIHLMWAPHFWHDIQRWLKSLHEDNGFAWTTISKMRGVMHHIYQMGRKAPAFRQGLLSFFSILNSLRPKDLGPGRPDVKPVEMRRGKADR